MKKIKTEDAVGRTLCHDLTAIMEDGFKGVRFRRGHVIREEDIPAMLDMGKYHVFVWEENADEVHEDDAAREAVCCTIGENIRLEGPSEGKMSLRAACNGLYMVKEQALIEINRVPDYTFASLRNKTAVKAGQQLCGARIVPLVTARENVDRAKRIAEENAPVFTVKAFRPLRTKVLITGEEIYSGRIKDAFAPVLKKKLEYYGAVLLGCVFCPDDEEFILRELQKGLEEGAELFLLTGGMSVDPDDVTPSAIRRTGADMIVRGVPIQPGNMLTIAKDDRAYYVGVPGASMHAEFTSLDIFLPRIFAGDAFSKDEFAGYCLGGLL